MKSQDVIGVAIKGPMILEATRNPARQLQGDFSFSLSSPALYI